MFRRACIFVVAVFCGCEGRVGNPETNDDESHFVSAAEVEGLQAPKVEATPPEIKERVAGKRQPPSVNGNLPERPAITPEVAASPMPTPDAEAWSPDSPFYTVFKEDAVLNSDAVAGGAQ